MTAPLAGPAGPASASDAGASDVRARATAGGLHRAAVQARGDPRAPAVPPPARRRRARFGSAGAARCARSPSCGPGTSSSTRITASRGSPGFDTKTVAGVTRDYLNLEYAGSDRVFMPVEQLAKISRYVGGGGEHGPTLSKLGGTRWDTLKARARKAAQEHGRRAAQPVRRAQTPRGPRVPARHRLAARVRGRLPLHGDARISATRSSSSRPTWRRRGRWTA